MAKQGVNVNVSGTKDVIKSFKMYGLEGRRVLKDLTEIGARDVERSAKKLVPVDTGKLRQSIKAERKTIYSWMITAYEKYAKWIEFGTSKMSAQPFMRPAWRFVAKRYIRDLKIEFAKLGRKFNK